MDAFLESAAADIVPAPALDGRAPVGARTLLLLAHLDAQIERLRLEQMSLVRRLAQVTWEARAAHDELRAQEIQIMFVESSTSFAPPAEAVQRLREWLHRASSRCAEMAALARSETEATAESFDSIHRRTELLFQRRGAVPVSADLLRLYEASAWSGSAPRVVAVERDACSACGARAPLPRPEGGVRACAGCRRVLYWRQVE